MKALIVYERRIVIKIYSPTKGKGTWKIRRHKEVQDVLQGSDVVKFIKSLRLPCYRHIERMNNERIQNNSDCQNGRNKEKRKTMEETD
jgi:hypothetical protein